MIVDIICQKTNLCWVFASSTVRSLTQDKDGNFHVTVEFAGNALDFSWCLGNHCVEYTIRN